MFSDAPSAPGLPEIVDWDETMVKLKWEPPIRDGGAPITGDLSIVLCMFQTTVKPRNHIVSLVRCVLYAWKGVLLITEVQQHFSKNVCVCVCAVHSECNGPNYSEVFLRHFWKN